MEFHTDLYKRTFSKLTASPDQIKEVIEMTENRKPKKFVLRRLVVTASALALVFVLAAAANAASGGALLARVIYHTSYTQDGQPVEEMAIEITDDGSGEMSEGKYEIIQDGDTGKALLVHIDENGNRTTQEIDIEDTPSAQASIFRLEDEKGNLKEAEVSGISMDEAHGKLTIQYTDTQGKEASAVLVLPEDCKGFESFGELLMGRKTIAGQTEDGRQFEIAAGK